MKIVFCKIDFMKRNEKSNNNNNNFSVIEIIHWKKIGAFILKFYLISCVFNNHTNSKTGKVKEKKLTIFYQTSD